MQGMEIVNLHGNLVKNSGLQIPLGGNEKHPDVMLSN